MEPYDNCTYCGGSFFEIVFPGLQWPVDTRYKVNPPPGAKDHEVYRIQKGSDKLDGARFMVCHRCGSAFNWISWEGTVWFSRKVDGDMLENMRELPHWRQTDSYNGYYKRWENCIRLPCVKETYQEIPGPEDLLQLKDHSHLPRFSSWHWARNTNTAAPYFEKRVSIKKSLMNDENV